MSSGLRTAFVYTSRFLEFDYGPGHPLRNERLGLTYDLISACELLSIPSTCSVEPEPATDDELLVFLKPDYLTVLKAADAGHSPLEAFEYGLGTPDNPILPGIYRWSALVAGARYVPCAWWNRGRRGQHLIFPGVSTMPDREGPRDLLYQ